MNSLFRIGMLAALSLSLLSSEVHAKGGGKGDGTKSKAGSSKGSGVKAAGSKGGGTSSKVGSSKGGGSNGASHVHIQGHTRSNGTYVAPHVRTRPDTTLLNNWSTKGNVNPYTGKSGTRSPYSAPAVKPPPTRK